MTKPRVFIYPGDSNHDAIEMFERRGFEVVKDFEQVDLVCFLGGTDVDPRVYGEEPGPYTQSPDKMRDSIEVTDFGLWKSRGVPQVGICRGGQLLNVLNGGKMIQHLGYTVSGDVKMFRENHDHSDVITVRVDHHQGMVVREDISYIAFNPSIKGYPDYVIYYEDTKSLCVQFHPEWGHKGTEDYFFELIKAKIGLEGKV